FKNKFLFNQLNRNLYTAIFSSGILFNSVYAQQNDIEEIDSKSTSTAQEVIQLDAVNVIATIKKNTIASGTLGSRSDLETPFSSQHVDAKQIEQSQAKTIGKLFEGDASIESKGSSYGLDAYSISVRGLNLDFVNGYKIDGHPFQMYGVELPLELFEQVQVLKGATGFLYGIGSPGGTVNYISKKPTSSPKASLSVGYSSDDLFSQHADIGGHFDEAHKYGYRFNLVNEQGRAFNGTKVDRQAASLYLTAQLSPKLDIYANGFYQKRNLNGGISTISIANSGNYAYSGTTLPKAISGRKDLTAYDSSYYDSIAWGAATGLNWQFNDQWSLHGSYSHTLKQIDSRDETLYLRNSQGDYNLALRQFYRPTLAYDSVQLRLEGMFNTGWLKHQLIAGIDWQRQTRDLNIGNPNLNPATNTGGQNYVYPGTGTYPAGNLYDSSLNLIYGGYAPREYFRISNWNTKSAYISDTLSVNDAWSVLLGLRKFDYENSNYYVSGRLRSHYQQNPVSPTVALLWHPQAQTTVYASYVEALEDGGTVGSTYTNAYQQLDPVKSKQYELGIKTEQKNWSLASALFRIERGTGYANAQNQYVVDGIAQYDGLEFNGQFKATDFLRLNASGVWINAEYTKAADDILGKQPTAVARFQGSFGFEKDFRTVEGLTVHGNIKYIGKQYINNANTLHTSSYQVVNLGAIYRQNLGQHQLIYRAEINNLFDQDYWIASTNALQIGAPRTLSLNLQYDF
ncbi:TonB-dependent siderophore receptor, partial [Acinetobacter qingfengensis]